MVTEKKMKLNSTCVLSMPRFQISKFPQVKNDLLHVPKGNIYIYISVTYNYLCNNGVLLSCDCVYNIGLEHKIYKI